MTSQTYNFHPYIDEYMEMVESGKVRACKEQKQLVALVRETLLEPNVYIDAQAIEDSMEVPKPYFPFELFPWQKFVNACVFGVRYKDTGRLVWNQIFLLLGRGAGKNGYGGWKNFYMLSKQHGVKNYNIEWVATSEKQAKTTFNDVKNVLEDPKHEKMLKKVFYKSKELIQHKGNKSQIQYNTSNARTKDGLRPGAIFFDEIHEFEDYAPIKVFRSALGKVKDGRTFYLTTDGYVRGGVLDDLKEKSRLVLTGEVKRSKLFPFICKLDNEEEVEDPENWEKANPSIRYNDELFETMKEEWVDCQTSIPMRVEFMTKRMNMPQSAFQHKIATYEDILATDQPLPDDLHLYECVAGLDYAELRDFCSVGLLFKRQGKRYWIHHTFIWHGALKVQDINPDIIQIGIEKGLFTIVYDKEIKPERVVNWFLEKAAEYDIKYIAIDKFRSVILKPLLEQAGFHDRVQIVRRGQYVHAMLDPLIQHLFINHMLVFHDDPVMRWYCGNIYVDELGNGSKEYKKIDAVKRKTDGFFAFTHALNFDGELEDYPADMNGMSVWTY
ncbi:terminase large subunit [Bacillus mycoides]|uniref:terminase large subunit domain-containing protein n=2 Tax=Bacillus mycoides TaxID=1405 RepID=UPI001C01A8F4|nr:terminase large subunit [Bacillus mycoides]QWH77290.1 terminase large subunit [Bacillus mycoides]QWI42339.1 terminase large subunit [Bacillus mycoides]